MGLSPRLDLRQSQSLTMTPQLQQAVKLLALSNLEVEAFLAEAVERNPLLSTGAEEGEAAVRPEEAVVGADRLVAEGQGDAPLDVVAVEETVDRLSRLDHLGSGGGGEEIDFDGFACADGTLCDALIAQAALAFEGEELTIARALIEEIDEDGYLRGSVRDVAHVLDLPLSRVERVLDVLQTFEPSGVAARDLAECLAIQAREADRYDPCMQALIAHLDLLALGRTEQLMRLCRVDEEDFRDMLRELRGYDPKPGRRYSPARIEAVEPDVFVIDTGAGFRIELNAATAPRVRYDRRKEAALASSARDKASKAWLGGCAGEAKALLRAIDQRQRTIVRVATEIVKRQAGFFREGAAALRPLTLRDVADALDLHESTVSRATGNKWLGCARGTFELKYFFASGVATDGGEGASATAVKAAIRTLIAGEGAKILSDDTLVELLRAKGFDLARRTVAKYREAMGIGSSIERRRAAAISRAA